MSSASKLSAQVNRSPGFSLLHEDLPRTILYPTLLRSPSSTADLHPSKGMVFRSSFLSKILASGETVSLSETEPDADGHFKRIRVLKTGFKYPLLRIEDDLQKNFSSGSESLVKRHSMVADHVIVKLEARYTQEDLQRFVSGQGFEIRKAAPEAGIFLVSFEWREPAAMEKALQTIKKSKIAGVAEPDYILRAGGR